MSSRLAHTGYRTITIIFHNHGRKEEEGPRLAFQKVRKFAPSKKIVIFSYDIIVEMHALRIMVEAKRTDNTKRQKAPEKQSPCRLELTQRNVTFS